MDETPAFMLTGFLGAGKSTLLGRLLREPAFADTAALAADLTTSFRPRASQLARA